MRIIFNCLAALTILFSCHQDETNTADKIYFNARIWTGDTANAWAEAIAIKGNEIIYAGKDYSLLKGAKTEIIDLGGKLMLPGFIDNHTHFLSGGYTLSGVDLHKAKTPREFISILKEFCRKYNDDRWILGGNWDHEAWGGELPARSWIDSVTGNHPIFVNRYDGHMALANSKALELAGVNKNTNVSAGGEMKKDNKGKYTGIFKDEAMKLMYKVIPDPAEKELDEYMQAAMQHAFENGVTQVHDMGSYGGWIDLAAYRRNYANKKLDLRIYSFVPLHTWAKLDSFCKKEGKGDDILRWGGLKGFVDGSLGSTTAWFYQPYLDDLKTSGFYVTDTTDMHKWILAADSVGLHIAVHAIGDRANDFILNVYEEAEKKNTKDHRFRIEHAQHLTQQAIPRFAQLKVIPSMQPYHAIDDGRWAYKRLDDARLKGTYAFKSLLDTKAKLTFGSDWYVAPLKPIQGIYAAVTRRTLDDKNSGGWHPEQKISVEQAVKCYTINNAYAGFQENKLGVLKKGMLADFVVLSENIFEIAPENIKNVKVLRTIINGKQVFIKNRMSH
jgi:predicted amidohydrolase YtcJ